MRSLNAKVGSLLAAIALAGCFESSTENKNDTGIKAQAYVAVGNSLTAGFQSGGLRKDWQEASYPSLLAKAMGVEDWQIPAIDSPGIGRQKIGGKTATPLFVENGSVTAVPLTVESGSLLSNRSLTRPYNDLGVPGATTKDFMHAYDSSSSQAGNNGYFNIVLRGGVLNNTSMMRQAILLKPTVMTMWVGNNDILGGITEGTVVEGVTVTPISYYSSLMDSALDTLTRETAARIFLANIPSITTIPFVTTIPPVVINPATNTPVIDTTTGKPIPLLTKEANVKYVLLPALAVMKGGTGIPVLLGGKGDSLAANLTLTVEEAATAERLTLGYNAYLKAKAEANPTRLTLVDVNGLLVKLTKGEIAGLTATFPLLDPTKSAFSLDGIHPNSKGYKELAKLFADVINSTLTKTYKIE